MAPFRFLNHHSFRRSTSSQLADVPASGPTQLIADMGGAPSKVGSAVSETSHKKLRPRSSSLHLLKRNRTPSGHAAARASYVVHPAPPVVTSTVEDDDTGTDYTRISTGRRSGSGSTVKTLSDSVHASQSLEDGKDVESSSDTSSTGTIAGVTSNDQEDTVVHHPVDEPSGMTTPVPPAPPRTPHIMLPTPPFLTEDSPTKYGLRITHTPSPERSLTNAQRKKMSGAGLFVVCVTIELDLCDPD